MRGRIPPPSRLPPLHRLPARILIGHFTTSCRHRHAALIVSARPHRDGSQGASDGSGLRDELAVARRLIRGPGTAGRGAAAESHRAGSGRPVGRGGVAGLDSALELVPHRVPGPARSAARTACGRRRGGRCRGRGSRGSGARGRVGGGSEGGEAGVLSVLHRPELPRRPRNGGTHGDGALGGLRQGRSRRGAGSGRQAVSGLAAHAAERIRAAPARRLDGREDGGRSRLGRAAAARRGADADRGRARGADSRGNPRRFGLPGERASCSAGHETRRSRRCVPGGNRGALRGRVHRPAGPEVGPPP